MGFKEINMATDAQLKNELAIHELGIRLSLKQFCASHIKNTSVLDEREQKKQKLIAELIEGKKSRTKLISSETGHAQSWKSEQNLPTCNLLMGWIHNGIRVGLQKGGGTREMKAPVSYSYKEVIESGKKWFFTDGKSSLGNEQELKFGLADFKREPLADVDAGGVPFTLGHYAKKNGFKSRVRTYFTSERKEQTVGLICSSDEDDLPISWSELEPTGGNKSDEICTEDSEETMPYGSDLLGTTQERLELREEQDNAYYESLAVDFKKANDKKQELEKEMKDVARQEKLRSEREKRVQAEPNIEQEHVIVLVRHLTLGTVSRMFLKNSTMNQVYDWVGSLHLVPEHFKLVYPVSGQVLLPESPVTAAERCVLNMTECDEAISLLHDDSDISAVGFAENAGLFADSLISKIPDYLPDQIMEEDSGHLDTGDSEIGAVSKIMFCTFQLDWHLFILLNVIVTA